MTAVGSQPIHFNGAPILLLCIILSLLAMTSIIVMTGTATTPLLTALHKSALSGIIGENAMAAPRTVVMAIVASNAYAGTAAAVANRICHASGKRVRQLPIAIDKLP